MRSKPELSEAEIAYLEHLISWCELGSTLWFALYMLDVSESDWCALVRFSRRHDLAKARAVKPYIDRLLTFPWIFRNGQGPLY